MRIFIIVLLFTVATNCHAQKSYIDSIIQYKRNYIYSHEVVKSRDRKYFRFYPISKKYAVWARFEKSTDTTTVVMKTSGKTIPEKDFYRYGKLVFNMAGVECELTLFQSKLLMNNTQYKNYLFLPFTDSTTAVDSYGAGRYLDILTTDIQNNQVWIDFNKSYNPYCAYASGYNCPIPPRENRLKLHIKAGEKNFAKPH